MAHKNNIKITKKDDIIVGTFSAMASPCEVLIETADFHLAEQLTQLAATEAWRIEEKYSRYNKNSVLSKINNSAGNSVEVDTETAQLLNFAFHCYQLSHGLFDITAGVLRKAWDFQKKILPTQDQVNALLPRIGLTNTHWAPPHFCLKPGMEIDFGGLGKEYAVDNALKRLVGQASDTPVLLNFGGDIAATARKNKKPWLVGIEATTQTNSTQEVLAFMQGGIATSGDSQRCILHDDKRYGHILSPLTGWPVEHSPRAITVVSDTCTTAGILSTLAMLQGAAAEEFLKHEEVRHWVQR